MVWRIKWWQITENSLYVNPWWSNCVQSTLARKSLFQRLYNSTHGWNGFNGLCTKYPGYNDSLFIIAHFSGTKGVVVNKFDCTYVSRTTFL